MVIKVCRRGKGNVMRAIFDTVKADALVVVDGDDTYFAEEVNALLEPVVRGEADMVVGNRLKMVDKASIIQLHLFGNHLIVKTINFVFGTRYQDVLSGYRVFSRKFVESVPLLTSGFETETELTLQALEEGFEVREIAISYRPRPQTSLSKLRPFRDGFAILMTIAIILRDHHPLRLYGVAGVLCFLVLTAATVLRFLNYFHIHTFPDSFLTGIILLFAPLTFIFFGIGFMLSAINVRFKEIKQILRRNR